MKLAVVANGSTNFVDQFEEGVIFNDLEQCSVTELLQYDAIAINGNHAKYPLSYDVIQKLWTYVEEGGLLYGEMIPCEDFPSSRLFGFKQDFPVTNRRLEKLKWTSESGAGSLLEWNGSFMTGFSIHAEPILEIGIFQDTHKTQGAGTYPALSIRRLGKGTVLFSAFSLFSNQEVWSLRPDSVWRKLFHQLKAAYGLPVKPFQSTIHFQRQSIEEAVIHSVKWFSSSGIMPEENGSCGVYENVHSFKGDISKDMRPDCNAHTALMFHLIGEYTGEQKYMEVSKNILKYLFTHNYQDMDKLSPTYGFWKWFAYPGEKPDQIFTDDNAWVAAVLLFLYRRTGIEEYKVRGLATAKAMLETQNQDGLRPEVLLGEDLRGKGRGFFRNSGQASMNPHFESIAHAAFIQAYIVSSDPVYLETAKKGTLHLLEHFDQLKFMYSRTSGLSRFLLPIVQLVKLTGDERIHKGMCKVIGYLQSKQHPLGGIMEADNPAPDRYGSEDTGVFIHDDEQIADQLYTNNFLAMNIWEAWKATGNKGYYELHQQVADFLANIQIHSDKREFDGGWMRSYHLGEKEYFGNNGDTGWGPYCIESGWTNGIATSGLLLKLIDVSLLD